MISAARLKEVTLFSRSMVKTPSLMLSRIVQQGALRADVMLQDMGAFSIRGPVSFWF